MRKRMKVLIVIMVILITLFVVVISNISEELTFYEKAEDVGVSSYGDEKFNSMLKDCKPSFGGVFSSEKWEIRGLEDKKCVTVYKVAEMINSEEGSIDYVPAVICNLPYDIYTNPQEMNSDLLLENGHCYLVEESNQNGDEILPTFWELNELPRAYDYLGFSSCIYSGLKDKVNSTACVVTDLDTRYYYEWKGDLKAQTTCGGICLDRNYLAKLPTDDPIKVLIYYDFNDYGGNPKVLQTEIVK